MNILLWVLQVALAVLCIAGGAYKIVEFGKLQEFVAAMRALPQGLWMCLGAFECVAGLGLVLPRVLRVQPRLTPIAAAAVAAESVLVSAIYVAYGDYSPLVFTVAMAIMAAVIAYGRSARMRT